MKISNNPAKYEVLIKQYLHSILDISEPFTRQKNSPPRRVHWAIRQCFSWKAGYPVSAWKHFNAFLRETCEKLAFPELLGYG